jgi:hypothetical protein
VDISVRVFFLDKGQDMLIVILLHIVINLKIALNCWARSGDVMCFLLGTDKTTELSLFLLQWPHSARLECWDRGFKSKRGVDVCR